MKLWYWKDESGWIGRDGNNKQAFSSHYPFPVSFDSFAEDTLFFYSEEVAIKWRNICFEKQPEQKEWFESWTLISVEIK